MMEVLHKLTFASEAEMVALTGAGFILLALTALFMDKRRAKGRSIERLEKVGFMPWTAIFLGSMIIGGGMLALALPRVIGGLI
ncbi:MAG: hypothetical protein ABJP34_12845 [Erythrobacter sp.]